jgi:hypothetical protein
MPGANTHLSGSPSILIDSGIDASIGTVGNAYVNALADYRTLQNRVD